MLLDDSVVTIEAPTVTGTTTIDSAAYDMSRFAEIIFIVRLGSPAANNNIRARQDVASGGAFNDLQGTLVGSATLNQLMVSVSRPGKQFVKCRVTRGTTTTIDSITVIQSRARTRPVVQPATAIFETWVAPPEGTA